MAEQQGNGGFLHSLYENMYLLLVLGLVIPIVSYTVWGLVDFISEPQMDVDKYMSELKAAPAQAEAQPAAQPEQTKP
ncbi:MAG: hypothetical protein A2073_08545 [Deltaproteobacteria bacterium GWC2_42_11]|nr:MAG: hypothetical protein A2073_08545 [Deltaproteobacteria bacterium GWC2_42_11]HBO83915.1 hypothetical protein [Deltaproteobacteria bacterium]